MLITYLSFADDSSAQRVKSFKSMASNRSSCVESTLWIYMFELIDRLLDMQNKDCWVVMLYGVSKVVHISSASQMQQPCSATWQAQSGFNTMKVTIFP